MGFSFGDIWRKSGLGRVNSKGKYCLEVKMYLVCFRYSKEISVSRMDKSGRSKRK